jgi:Ca2+-transporting ATPase
MITEKGLRQADIPELQKKFGKNIYQVESSRNLFHIIWEIVKEPLFLLLVIGCCMYFILGEINEGIMMALAMVLVTAISVFQDARSTKALKALKEFTEPKVVVIRDGTEKIIDTASLVPGDIIILEEGNKIPADAQVLQANDLTVNESVITGESLPVEKTTMHQQNQLYQGSVINTGKCTARVTATGNHTVLGKLGTSVASYSYPKTLLQEQIGKFVKLLAFLGLTAFVIICIVTYTHTGSFAQSLLAGLTLALAAIPEEIPVAFSSFMALGALYMSKRGIISRQPQTIENLGATTIICLDKTGTITENRMQVKEIYSYASDRLADIEKDGIAADNSVLIFGRLASEPSPFDPMEMAILEAFEQKIASPYKPAYKMVHEYPLLGKPPMMTHVYESLNKKIVAAKGAMERIVHVCKLDAATVAKITGYASSMASKGYRVIGVASAVFNGPVMPSEQDQFDWQFEGLLSLYDPPRKNVATVFQQFYEAKIGIKLLTGDYPETAMTIARQVNMQGVSSYLTGDAVMQMNKEELATAVSNTNLFARMFPEAKFRVIEALKANGEIVAMTGDGVNDGPALKSANIGIALGKKGTEIARQAADLILTDDNISNIVEAVRQGRKIFSNLKKAVRYIISIHIPIILTASLPLLLGWKYPAVFTPIHIIFLELIMGPTCSVFFEREPVEENIMRIPPRNRKEGLFRRQEFLISIIQGLIISFAVLGLYFLFMQNDRSLAETRTVVFTTLVMCNIFLTFVNRSFRETINTTIFYKNNLAPWVLAISVLFLALIHLNSFASELFGLSALSYNDFALCTGVAFISIFWFEAYKLICNNAARSIKQNRYH